MKSRILILLFSVSLAACQSEISDKPAAEVTDPTTTTAAAMDPSAPSGPTTNVVKESSKIEWVGAKVTRDHKGSFPNFDGWIAYSGSTPSKISFEIDLTTLESDDPKLTGHLKSADFFEVSRYPKATFTSTSLSELPAGSAGTATHELKGILDLHGVQKEVTIPVTAQVTPQGVRTTSEFTINRQDWGINYPGAANDLIKDNVLIRLDLMFPPPPATV